MTEFDTPAAKRSADELQAIDERLTSLESAMTENNKLTAEVREILDTAKSGLKVLSVLGRIAKWAVPVVALATACMGFWAQIKGSK